MNNSRCFPTYARNGKVYTLPYHLPEGKAGKLRIQVEVVKPGTKLPVVSVRNSLFMGLPAAQLNITEPLHVHYLREDRGTWMSSMPQEIEQHSRQLAGMSGRVLVGGLGLGLAVHYLQQMPAVKQIIVVEKSYKVIELVYTHLPKDKVSLFRDDLFHFLEDARLHCDYAFYDIWRGTSEMDFTKYVMPLRKLSEGKILQENIQCWNEDEMLGQIRLGCMMSVNMLDLPEGNLLRQPLNASQETFNKMKSVLGPKWYWYRWLREEKPEKATAAVNVDEFMSALRNPAEFEAAWVR